MSRRQALALVTILALCAVVVFAAHGVWHRHQSAALARTPSYKYGASMMDLVTKDLLVRVIDPRAACRNDLASMPGTRQHKNKRLLKIDGGQYLLARQNCELVVIAGGRCKR